MALATLLVLGSGANGWAQTPNGWLDFGSPTDATTATTANTGFGGVRIGTGNGGFTIANPGQSIGSAGELRGIAPTGGSINSVGITSTEYGTAATTFTVSFEVYLSGGSSGTWYFFAGNGASFGSAQSSTFTGAQIFSGLRWTFGASSAITTDNRNAGAWNATGITGTPFAQGTAYYVTIVGNNSAATVNYGVGQSIAANTYDLWVNGTLVGNDLPKAQLPAASNINAFRFYGENSVGNVATLAVDNIRWYNSCMLPATHLTFVGVPSAGTPGNSLPSFTVEARSGSAVGPLATGFTGTTTLIKSSGSGVLGGTLSPTAMAGVATFGDIQFSAVDTYKISAAAAAPVISATSGNIIITKADTTTTVASSANLALPGTPVTFTATVAAGNGTPTGTVTFKDGSTTLGTGTLNGSAQATFTTSSLVHGSHSITAGYDGDGNFNASPASTAVNLVINTPPAANGPSYARAPGVAVKIYVSDLLAAGTDADNGDTLALVSHATSTGNGVVLADYTIGGQPVIIYPSDAANTDDSFTYTISDGHGGTATGTVSLTLSATVTGQSASITINGHTATMTFYGVPNYRYVVQRTTDLNGQTGWADIPVTSTNASVDSQGVITAPAGGAFTVTDSPAPTGSAFYQLRAAQ